MVQLATLLILYTGGNTSFNGFPFLASFVAGDRFLPRQLTRRGHRLTFSNGIIVLAVVAIALVVAYSQCHRPGGGLRHRRVHRLHHGRGRHEQAPPEHRAGAGSTAGDQRVSAFLSFVVVGILVVAKFRRAPGRSSSSSRS